MNQVQQFWFRCQDGWYKGTSNRTQKCGVFPGNYVTPARGAPGSPLSVPADSKLPVSFTRGTRNRLAASDVPVAPPELPPRSNAPSVGGWHIDSPARTNSSTNAKSDKVCVCNFVVCVFTNLLLKLFDLKKK